ncbi:MAG: TonB-dependent receptor [Ignavibacteriae bacterium]|nr:TonB-dependent receptor [Ignavibacteriota bacterium]
MKSTVLIGLLLRFSLWLLATSLASAQPYGSVEGAVTQTGTGQVIAGASVLVLGLRQGSSTDSTGFFRINGLPVGSYALRISSIGYHSKTISNVTVNPGLRTRILVELIVSPLELDPIQIVAEAPPILKDVTGTTHTVSREEIAAFPVSSISDVVALQPGVTSDLHFRGGKTSEVTYLIDGLPIQDLISGGLAGDIPSGSIGGILIHTGGFEAEYGNALSGVVNVFTSGATDKHEVHVRGEADDLFGGKQFNRAREVELTGSGPALKDELYYSLSSRARFSNTRYWQDFERFFSSPITREYTGVGKIEFRGARNIRVTGQLWYALRDFRDYEFSWRFNLVGLPPQSRDAYRAAVFFTHSPSPFAAYTVSFSRNQIRSHLGNQDKSSIDTTLYQYDFFLRYVLGGSRSWWASSRQITHTLKVDVTQQLGDNHFFKSGIDLNLYSIYSDVVRYEPQTNVYGKPFVSKPLLNYSTDFSYRPLSGSAYIQDKIELRKDGMLLNIGFRYDYLDPRAERPAVERVPDANNLYETRVVGYVPARRKHYVSPRIGFAAPFAEYGYLFVHYGHFIQFPLFEHLYSGLNNVTLRRGIGILIGNPDLEAEKTKAWEISVKYALENDLVFSATYFDKTTYNQVDVKTFVPANARIAGDYGFAEFVNNPYAKARGVELSIARKKEAILTGSLSYTLMQAEGLSQDAKQGLSYYQWGLATPARMFPLSWDQRHTIRMIANVALPWDINVSLNWSFHTGRPYTHYPTVDGFTPIDSTLKFMANNERVADYSLLDLKATKTFNSVLDLFALTLYVDARNVFNKANVLWVDSSGKIGGELGDVSAVNQPRRVNVGIRVRM